MTIRGRGALGATFLIAAALSASTPRATIAQQPGCDSLPAPSCAAGGAGDVYGSTSPGLYGGAPPGNLGEPFAGQPLDLGEAAPAQIGATFALAAPNLIGDFFGGAQGGGGSYIIDSVEVISTGISGPVPLRFDGTRYSLTGTPSPGNPATFTTQITAAEFYALLDQNTVAGLPTPSPGIINNSNYQQIANNIFLGRNAGGGTTVFNPSGSFIEGTVTTPSGSHVNDGVNPPPANPPAPVSPFSPDILTADAHYAYDYVINIDVAPPGTGGLVGIQKLVENSSPIPRDRLLFNYSMFHNVRFTSAGVDVNRFVVGFEKTFLDQFCSLELRVPFASTMSADQIAGTATAMSTEFGNLTLYGKALMASGESYAVGAGLGLALPTADEVNVRSIDGTPLVRIDNQAVQLLPYVGAIYAPSPDWYSQAILQVSTPTSGNDTFLNTGNGLTKAGSINDPTWLFASINAGYWVYRASPEERLSGVSPLVELHYNKTLNTTDAINAGPFRIGNSFTNIEMINAVVGANFEFFGRSYVSVAYVAPLTNGADRFFDGELRVLCNRYWW